MTSRRTRAAGDAELGEVRSAAQTLFPSQFDVQQELCLLKSLIPPSQAQHQQPTTPPPLGPDDSCGRGLLLIRSFSQLVRAGDSDEGQVGEEHRFVQEVRSD